MLDVKGRGWETAHPTEKKAPKDEVRQAEGINSAVIFPPPLLLRRLTKIETNNQRTLAALVVRFDLSEDVE